MLRLKVPFAETSCRKAHAPMGINASSPTAHPSLSVTPRIKCPIKQDLAIHSSGKDTAVMGQDATFCIKTRIRK